MGSNGACHHEASRTSSSLSSPGHSFEHGTGMHHRVGGHNEIMANNYISSEGELEQDCDLSMGHEPGENGQGSEQQKLRPRLPSGHEETAADEAAALTKHDFLVSFLVDARGGSLKGCRYSGVKVSTSVLTVSFCEFLKLGSILNGNF